MMGAMTITKTCFFIKLFSQKIPKMIAIKNHLIDVDNSIWVHCCD